MRKYIFLSVFLVASTCCPAQKVIDSLLREVKSTRHDTVRAHLYDLIAYQYSMINPDSGLKYGQLSLEFSEKAGWKQGIAAAHSDLALNYEAKGQHSLAIYHHEKALEDYTTLGMQRSMAAVLGNISTVHQRQGNYPSALSYAHKALEIYETIGDTIHSAYIWENMGTIYLRQKNYEAAINNYSTALKLHERAGNKVRVASVFGNMGIVHDAEGRYSEALVCHFQALEVNRGRGNKYGEQVNLMNVGLVYCHMREFDTALVYQFQALRISEASGLQGDMAVNMGNIGETYYFMALDSSGKYDRKLCLRTSITYLVKAMELCKATNYLGPLIEFGQYLSSAYSQQGEYEMALSIFKEVTAINDSISAQEHAGKIGDIESQRELMLKEKELEIQDKQLQIVMLSLANKRNERIIFIIGILLLLALVSILLVRYTNKMRMHKAVLADIAEIQSHQLRGPIARMLGLVQLLEREPADHKTAQVVSYIHDVSIEIDEIVRKASAKATETDYPRQ